MIISRFHGTAFLAILLTCALPLSGAKCGSKGKPIEYPPPPPNVLLQPSTRAAQAAGAAIGKYIPAVYRSYPLRIRVVSPKELFAVRARDKFDPHPEGVSGIIGYCQMPANNPDGDDGYTTIFLSDKLSESRAAEVAGHEIGHPVYHLVISEEARAKWLALWQRLDKDDLLPVGSVTSLMNVSSKEAFAECFMMFYAGRLESPKYEPLRSYFGDLRTQIESGR